MNVFTGNSHRAQQRVEESEGRGKEDEKDEKEEEEEEEEEYEEKERKK